MNNENLIKIHEASMRILNKTGVKFHHPDAVEILKANGVRMEGNVAYFTEDEIMGWIKKAPSEFKLYATNPEHDITIGGDVVNVAPCYGCPIVVKPNGEKYTAVMEDYIKALKLYEANDSFDVNGGVIVQPSDVPVTDATLLMYYATLTHSEKCLMTGAGSYEQLGALMDMVAALHGGKEAIAAKPRILTIVNVNTPLQFDKTMTETLITFAKHGQPFVVASAAMAGSTSPVTLAGTIAMANCEILATIALAQMVNPGTPLLYASQTTTADMRNGAIAIGSPEGALCYKYCAELAKFYGLPCRGGGALTDAKVVNAQSGYESMLTFKTCYDSKINYIIHSAGILDGYTCFSFEKMITDFEMIEYVLRYHRDAPANEETIPEELIDEVAQDGMYLTEMHTLLNCRAEPLSPDISVRGATQDPEHQLDTNIQNQMDKLINSYEKPAVCEEAHAKIKEILIARGISAEMLESIANA